MKIRFRQSCLSVVLLAFLWLLTPLHAYAQQNTPESMRAETIKNFKAWRADIPDYEKRLYDRVKSVNRRTVQLVRYTLWGFVITIIAVPGLVYWTSNRNGPAGPRAASATDGSSSSRQQNKDLKKFLKNQNSIRQQQAALRKSFDMLSTYYTDSREQSEYLTRLLERAESQLDALQNEIDAIGEPEKNSTS